MKYNRKDLLDKSELELVAIAKQLGIEDKLEDKPKSYIIDVILANSTKDSKSKKQVSKDFESTSKKYKLVIHSQEGIYDTPFVAVGVNGYVYQIPRDVEVEVPKEVIDILKEANYPVPIVNSDGVTVGEKMARRFPFSVLGEA